MSILASSTTETTDSNTIHFINSAHNEPGKYSCAIDSFLEISYHTIFPLISHVDRSNFWDQL